jgi:FKBP-type peptidyl-prolyl cis-trans isomerase SlyD
VRLRYWARASEDGDLLQYGQDLWYLHGGYGGVFSKVEAALEGREIGDRIELTLTPEEGYGHRDPSLVVVQPKVTIPEEAWQLGAVLAGELPDGGERPFVVTALDEDTITLDGNHPWAGRSLHFTFEVLESRPSTAEERHLGYPRED